MWGGGDVGEIILGCEICNFVEVVAALQLLSFLVSFRNFVYFSQFPATFNIFCNVSQISCIPRLNATSRFHMNSEFGHIETVGTF